MKLSRTWLCLPALVALFAASTLPSVHAFAWRLFAGREESINAYLPENQWKHIEKTGQVGKAQVMVDVGFLVTTKHDVEDDKANIDYGLYSPSNTLLINEQGVSEGDIETASVAESSGPYKLCVRVSGGKLLRPSVIIDISYFSIYYDGDDAGSVNNFHSGEDEGDAREKAATHEQIQDIENGLAKLDRYMHNVTSETRFLYARTLRHLRTAESTLRRTRWYYFAVYSIIVSASVSQIAVIRFLFRKNQRGMMML